MRPHPDHTWTVRNIPVPDVLTTLPLNVSNVLRGCPVQLLSIAGRSTHAALRQARPFLTGGKVSAGATNPLVHALFHAPDRRYQLRIIEAVDGRGHPVRSFIQRRSAEETLITLYGIKEGDTVNLTFGVARSHFVEFVAPPTILRTNIAHWANH